MKTVLASSRRASSAASDLRSVSGRPRSLGIILKSALSRALFNIIPSDLGRPLTDLKSLAADDALLDDAKTVFRSLAPLESEIQGQSGHWFVRRIMPYRASNEKTEGVVITYEDVTERRRTAGALTAAMRQAELASVAKSRFLAAASHDLRQPLQTLSLLQGILLKSTESARAHQLVERMGETLHAEISFFPVHQILGRLAEEFRYQAVAQGLQLRLVPCGLWLDSDPTLLE